MAEAGTDTDKGKETTYVSDYVGGGFEEGNPDSVQLGGDGVSLIDEHPLDLEEKGGTGEGTGDDAAAKAKAEEEAKVKADEDAAAKKKEEDGKEVDPLVVELRAQLVAKDKQHDQTIAILKTMQPATATVKEVEDEIPAFEAPTDEDWHKDPTAASEKVSAHNVAVALSKERKANQADQTTRDEGAVIKDAQDKSWATALTANPDLGLEDSPDRIEWQTLYTNPALGFQKHAIGPYLAHLMVEDSKRRASTGATVDTGNNGDGDDKDKKTYEDGLAEASRLANVKLGAMHGSGGGGGKGAVNLTPEEEAGARRIGVSNEAFADAKEELNLE